MFSSELPHRGDSKKYTKYTIFNIKRKITLNYLKWNFFSKGLEEEFKTAVVNKPSVFQPLKVFCIYLSTVMCLSIGTPKSNKFSICSKCTNNYFKVSQNLGALQPNYNVLKYWDTKNH